MKLDISFLFEDPAKTQKAILTIEPLAPLSIVSTMPGSYYKSQSAPTKYNLCGMFENILGLHIGNVERKAIVKKMEQVYKKIYRLHEFEKIKSPVGYAPLLGHLFEIEKPAIPVLRSRYDDLWKQQMKAGDNRHVKGTPNLSWGIIKKKRNIAAGDNAGLDELLKENPGDFPMYYTSPTPREFIVVEGEYQYYLRLSATLLRDLQKAIDENNLAYLGTNEGWVNMSIKPIQ